MPIVFVHGVAVRAPEDPMFAMATKLTGEIDWRAAAERIRTTLAPTLAPMDPVGVDLEFVYWGDLGAPQQAPTTPGARDDTLERLGERIETDLLHALPPAAWPDAVRLLWRTLAAERWDGDTTPDAAELASRVRARIALEHPEVPRWQQAVATAMSSRPRVQVRRAMDLVRTPSLGYVQVFLGDVLRYIAGRGTPQEPGPVIRRVVDALDRAHARAVERHEPLVVVTHSMGGQLVYDALTAFAGDRDWRVDFWAVLGGQIGFFSGLGVLLESVSANAVPLDVRVGYLWNVWSSSDVLSFPAQPQVPLAHDTDVAYLKPLAASHLAYLGDDDLLRTLAAKVEVHTSP